MMMRYARVLLLSSIVLLLALAILDLTVKKEALFVAYGEQFENVERTAAYNEAHPLTTTSAERLLELPREAIEEVVLEGKGSDITVKRAPGDAIQLHYTVGVVDDDADEAERKLDTVRVEGLAHEGRLTFEAAADGKRMPANGVSIDYVLLLPDGMKLSLDNAGGEVYVDGIVGDIAVVSESGSVEIVDVAGNLAIQSSHSSIYASDLTGNLDVDNRYSDTHVEEVTGNVAFDIRSGSSYIAGIDGPISGHAASSWLHLQAIAGQVELSGDNSHYRLADIRGDLRLRSFAGDASLVLPAGAGYTLDAAVRGGDIRTLLAYPVEQDRANGYDARIRGTAGDGRWNIDIEIRSGDLNIHHQKEERE
jgi:hypothetical protein